MSESSLDGVVSPTHRANPMIYAGTEPLSMLSEPDGTVVRGSFAFAFRLRERHSLSGSRSAYAHFNEGEAP